MDNTGTRLGSLESGVHGETAIITTTVGGWTVKTYQNGEKTASVGLDYLETTDFSWDEQYLAEISETIPSTIFTSITSVDCLVIDITPGRTTYLEAISIATKSLPSETNTGVKVLMPMHSVLGAVEYTPPEKIHIVWTARGV